MRGVIWALALTTLLVGAALADEDNLGGGVFIAHHVSQLAYSEDPGTICADYETYAISDSSEQSNRIDSATYTLANWFVIAGFYEDKRWCAIQFGIDDFAAGPSGIFGFSFWGPCFPATGGLEIPSGGWPGPNAGTALTVTGDPWSGNYLPMYYFGGYAYGYGRTGVIQLIPDPSIANPFGGFGNCLNPPGKWDAFCYGGMGINTDGVACGPVVPPPPPKFVCCFGPDCHLFESQSECNLINGEWFPDLESCDPNPCIHVCCLADQSCVLSFSQVACEQGLGGRWFPLETSCEPNPCLGEQPWACCSYDDCYELKYDECVAIGGEYHFGYDCEEVEGLGYGCADWQELHACCLDGYCHLVLEDECDDMGGVWHTNWSSCIGNLCILPWACCVRDECYMLDDEQCTAVGGSWHEGFDCDSVSCGDRRACCEAGNCSVLFLDECEAVGGTFGNRFPDCDPNPCPLWACCDDTGGCVVMTEEECAASGGFQSSSKTCAPNPCPNLLFVCCVEGECQRIEQEECEALGGDWHGSYTHCDSVDCADSLSVCCIQSVAYPELLWEDECLALTGVWHPEYGDTLDPDPCVPPLPKACCVGDECHDATPDSCAAVGGVYYEEWATCDPNPCPSRLRACCYEGSCFLITSALCDNIPDAIWHVMQESCDPNPCPPPDEARACCIEDAQGIQVCVLVTASACSSLGGEWHSTLDECRGIICGWDKRVCCVGQTCHENLWQIECEALSGLYKEDENSCDPNPCHVNPTMKMSWGRIKSLYGPVNPKRR